MWLRIGLLVCCNVLSQTLLAQDSCREVKLIDSFDFNGYVTSYSWPLDKIDTIAPHLVKTSESIAIAHSQFDSSLNCFDNISLDSVYLFVDNLWFFKYLECIDESKGSNYKKEYFKFRTSTDPIYLDSNNLVNKHVDSSTGLSTTTFNLTRQKVLLFEVNSNPCNYSTDYMIPKNLERKDCKILIAILAE